MCVYAYACMFVYKYIYRGVFVRVCILPFGICFGVVVATLSRRTHASPSGYQLQCFVRCTHTHTRESMYAYISK